MFLQSVVVMIITFIANKHDMLSFRSFLNCESIEGIEREEKANEKKTYVTHLPFLFCPVCLALSHTATQIRLIFLSLSRDVYSNDQFLNTSLCHRPLLRLPCSFSHL